ncbi:MAG: EF-hand domain-containing protein [Simplicispira sp.]|nr:EF-hand domain-containing protein [Simplicispira sp.]
MGFLRFICVTVAAAGCSLAGATDTLATAGAVPATEPAHLEHGADGATLSKGEIKAMRDFKLLDFNGDGKISRTEVALFPRLAAAFSDADTNRDDYLNYAEVRAYAVRYRAERDRQRALQGQAPNSQNP